MRLPLQSSPFSVALLLFAEACGRVGYQALDTTGLPDGSPGDLAGDLPPLGDGGPGTPVATITIENTGAATLTDYPVRIDLDTSSWGALPDCNDVAVAGPTSYLPFWVQDPTCGEAAGTLWIRVPVLSPGVPVTVTVHIDPSPALPSNGVSVFRFFDGFDVARSWASSPTGWVLRAGTQLQQTGDGYLRLPAGGTPRSTAIETSAAAIRAGQDAAGVRFRASPDYNDDFEIGAGTIATSTTVWHITRSGTWFSAVHWENNMGTPQMTMTSRASGACYWNVVAPAYATAGTWYEAELRYASATPNTFTFAPDVASVTPYQISDEGCASLPTALPLFVVLDADNQGQNTQTEVDWVYVRPVAAVEPTVVVR